MTSPLPPGSKLFCREGDRIDPSRMRRPCHRIGRTAFAQNPKILRELLQHRENIPLRWTRIHRSRARFSGSDASCRMSWLAGCITNTPGFRFSARTGRWVASAPLATPRVRATFTSRTIFTCIIHDADARLLDRHIQSSKIGHAALLLLMLEAASADLVSPSA